MNREKEIWAARDKFFSRAHTLLAVLLVASFGLPVAGVLVWVWGNTGVGIKFIISGVFLFFVTAGLHRLSERVKPAIEQKIKNELEKKDE